MPRWPISVNKVVGGCQMLVGILLSVAFLRARINRLSADPLWMDLLLWLGAGLLPLAGGVLLCFSERRPPSATPASAKPVETPPEEIRDGA